MKPWLYLASQSPRRAQILDRMGIDHQTLLADPDEDSEALEMPLRAEPPSRYVLRVARLKAQAAQARWSRRNLEKAPILAADTTVAVGRRILGKPRDQEDAARMLKLLAGRSHKVLTAVVLIADPTAQTFHSKLSESRVMFESISDQAIARYVEGGEPMGKAGAYGLQGQAELFVKRIVGSPSGIIGLPMAETAALLRTAGWRLP